MPPSTDLDQGDDDVASTQQKRERGRGQALVEFAIILPVFFLVVAGMFDFGLGDLLGPDPGQCGP